MSNGVKGKVQIQHWQRAHDFFLKYPKAKAPLLWWKSYVKLAQWSNFSEVKATFGHLADLYEDDWWVFDVGNNDFRVVAIVEFDGKQVWIKHVMTHEEYDLNKWKEEKLQGDKLRQSNLPEKKGG